MVGGTVVEVIHLEDAIWVACRDNSYPKDEPVAIYVERNDDSFFIMPGDQVWWQGVWAFWTPTTGEFVDNKIERLSYSGMSRPTRARLRESAA